MALDTLTLAPDLTITRTGYGTMQLPGPHVWGPPRDRAEALAVLRAARDAGITHVDTAEFYGDGVANDLLREALHPYPDDLHVATKVGSVRTPDGGWVLSRTPESLAEQVRANLARLRLDALDLVNLRMGAPDRPVEESLADQLGALVELQEQGLVRHIGLSTVTDAQLTEALEIAPIVAVQQHYNLVQRDDEAMLRRTADLGIAYVPYFPLGGFDPLRSAALSAVARRLGATPQQVALAWLLQRSPNVAVIPGTSRVAHLRENVSAAGVELPPDAVAELDAMSRPVAV